MKQQQFSPSWVMEFKKTKRPRTKTYPKITEIKTRAGFIWIFEKANIYGDVHDFLTMLNRPTSERRFGQYLGVILGEVPDEDQRILIEYTYKDPRIETRKHHKANLRKHRIPVWHFNKYMKKNTLDKFSRK